MANRFETHIVIYVIYIIINIMYINTYVMYILIYYIATKSPHCFYKK